MLQDVIVIPKKESAALLARLVDFFIDTSSQYYQSTIERTKKYSDGNHYQGFLWKCLKASSPILEADVFSAIFKLPSVYVLADDHSIENTLDILWPFEGSVIKIKSKELYGSLILLPQDLYIFDDAMGFLYCLTHEYDNRKRTCLVSSR
jgi:hypothetical protein